MSAADARGPMVEAHAQPSVPAGHGPGGTPESVTPLSAIPESGSPASADIPESGPGSPVSGSSVTPLSSAPESTDTPVSAAMPESGFFTPLGAFERRSPLQPPSANALAVRMMISVFRSTRPICSPERPTWHDAGKCDTR